MAKIIHGNDAWTGVQIREEDNAAYGTGVGTFKDIPIIRETLHTEYDFTPASPEFGGIGSQRLVDPFNKRIVGDLQFSARVDAPWFGILMAHLFGKETVAKDNYIDHTVTANCNTHWYTPDNTARSLQFRIFKSGPDNLGRFSTFFGLIVSSARIEWQEGNVMSFTLSFVGSNETHTDIAAETLGLPVGDIVTSYRWLTNAGAGVVSGATPGAINLNGFTINIDRKITADAAFLNSLNTVNQAGPTAPREITVEIQADLDQDYAETHKPYREFLDRVTTSSVAINLRDATNIGATGKAYAMLFDFPKVVWTGGDASIKEGGANRATWTFRPIEAVTTGRVVDTGACDMRMAHSVDAAEDGDTWYAAEVVQGADL